MTNTYCFLDFAAGLIGPIKSIAIFLNAGVTVGTFPTGTFFVLPFGVQR